MSGYEEVKTMLYAYPKLEMLAEAAEAAAEVKALLSFRAREDALGSAERVAEEILSGKRLRLLKNALDGVLEGLGGEELFLLEYKYFRRKDRLQECTEALSCSERSYFRKQNALLAKVAAELVRRGWTKARFFALFGGYPPFMRVYRALRAGRERAVVFKRVRKGIAFQNSGNS